MKPERRIYMTVIKRDGKTAEFDRSKIIIALSKANDAVEEGDRISAAQMEGIADFISDKKKTRILVEDILSNTALWGIDLSAMKNLVEKGITLIETEGVRKALEWAMA